MKLAAWLDLPNPDGSRKRRDKFADAIGVTPQMISAYCDGRYIPGKDVMPKIFAETGGAVTANDFFDMQTEAAQ